MHNMSARQCKCLGLHWFYGGVRVFIITVRCVEYMGPGASIGCRQGVGKLLKTVGVGGQLRPDRRLADL